MNEYDYAELLRLIRARTSPKPSYGTSVGLDRSIKSTDNYFDFTKTH